MRRSGLTVVAVAGILVVGCLLTIAAVAIPSGGGSGTRPVDPLARARRLLDEGRISQAKEIYLQELKRDPKSVEAVRGVAMCLRDAGNDAEAIAYWERIVRTLAPKDLSAWEQLALAFWRCKRSTDALSACQSGMAVAPDEPALSELLSKIMTSGADPMMPQPGRPIPGRPQPPDPSARFPQPPDPTRHFPKNSP